MDTNQLNYYFSKLIIAYFSNRGIKYAFVSPGSRNTPISLALSDQDKIKTHNIIDERSSAYIALGSFKSNKFPALVVTTSGTAVANLFPAIVEAYMSKTPMIILTADRPKNLINTGANQTINQTNIFGNYINKFFDADFYIQDLKNNQKDHSKINHLISEALQISMGFNGGNKGPVHINIPFEKPLHLEHRKSINVPSINRLDEINYTNNQSCKINYPDIKNISKPIIICTDVCNPEIIAISERHNIPIFMDCRGLRFGLKSKNIVSSYDFMFSCLDIKPDMILRFGSKPISNKLNDFINNNKNITYLIHEGELLNDDAEFIINTNIKGTNDFLIDSKLQVNKSWVDSIINYQKLIKEHINIYFKKPRVHEGYILNKIISKLPSNSNLMVGNSSPVRDLDKFTFNLEKKIKIFSNRGASGIDGIISTAIGLSIDQDTVNTLIIGDISFFYDLSSLINNTNISFNLNIFILNNQGGHIFDRLKGLSGEKEYQKYWLTPISVEIKDIAKTYDCNYIKIDSLNMDKIDRIVKEVSKSKKGIQLIEVKVDSDKHDLIDKEIDKNIKALLV
jgi:2-succinyl-5-enolpyruvyl-6-hydroxy-3-cyclohexene-1-carboxylate synthase